jgi:hypothetical protein
MILRNSHSGLISKAKRCIRQTFINFLLFFLLHKFIIDDVEDVVVERQNTGIKR